METEELIENNGLADDPIEEEALDSGLSEPDPKPQFIPKPRFDEINNELRSWKELGKSEEIKERLIIGVGYGS